MILRNASFSLLWMILMIPAVTAQSPADSVVPSDAEIRRILADRMGPENSGIGMVVGVIEPKGRRVVTYGSLAKDDKRPLNGDTIFEIGSMTKIFTSLALMDMAQKGEVAVTDPVSKFLPPAVKVPERNNRKITLQDLATQSSGLPRLPSNLSPKDQTNPYADYSVDQLYSFLAGYQLTRDIGSQYEYSNLGVGLLGYVLTLKAGTDYESLIRARICEPLGMNSTRVTLSPDMKARMAVGHGAALNAVPNWDLTQAMAGAGAFRSSANDMLTFLAANLGYTKTPLSAAMAAQVSIRKPAGSPDMQIAYGWHIQTKNGTSLIWHNGGTGGFRTYMGFDPKSRTGVVVLANVSSASGPDDIGRHLLDADYPLDKVEAPTVRTEITVDSKILDKYVGSYQLAPNAILAVSREGGQLFAQLTGQPKIPIFPESERKFFLKVVDAQVTFDSDSQGNTTQAILHQNGRDTAAKRVDESQAAALLDRVAKRFKDQKAAPGSEAVLRRNIEEVRAGQPKYDLMSPGMADVTRQQLTTLIATLNQLGAVQTVTFKGVGPGGADIFEVKFEHGLTEWRIILEDDGKIGSLGFRPL